MINFYPTTFEATFAGLEEYDLNNILHNVQHQQVFETTNALIPSVLPRVRVLKVSSRDSASTDFPVRLTEVSERSLVSELGTQLLSNGQLPVVVNSVITVVLKSTKRFTESALVLAEVFLTTLLLMPMLLKRTSPLSVVSLITVLSIKTIS